MEPRNNFEKLIIRYANGRQICKCREAYYENCGKGFVDDVYVTDIPVCRYGCSANLIEAKNYIADCVIKELDNGD